MQLVQLSEDEPAPNVPVLRPTGQTFRQRWESMDTQERRMWLLDSEDDADLYAVIRLGGMTDLLRRVTSA